MRTKLAMMAALFAGACATSSARTRPPTGQASVERAAVPAARHSPPARTPELDSDNTERRFGFAEARARRDEKLRAEREAHRHDQLGVVDGPDTSVPKAASDQTAVQPAPAAKPPCPCKTAAKTDHH